MFRRAHRLGVLIFVFLLRLTAFAQQSPAPANSVAASNSKQAIAARQSAMNMIEEVLAGTGSLALPQNRLAIEMEAFPMILARSQPRARVLINQMIGDFSQDAARSGSDHEFYLQKLRQERMAVTRTLEQSDAELALQFLTGTLPYVQSVSPKDDGPGDGDLLAELAARIAGHDPRRALQMAEQELQGGGGLLPSLISLLQEVERADPQSGAQLFHDLVDHVKQADLVSEDQNISFAATLLENEYERQSAKGESADDALRSLAEAVATAASSALFQRSSSFTLGDAWLALNALVPTRVAALHLKGLGTEPASLPSKSWQAFNNARDAGNDDKVVSLIAQASEEDRTAMAQQVVWQFANNGDLERTRQVGASLAPWQSNNAMNQALRRAAAVASEKGDFSSGRQFASQVTDEIDRATLLGELALIANRAGKTHTAEEMLGEATSLLSNHPPDSSTFAAQLTLAQDYLHVNSAQAIPMLERSAGQLEQVLTAAAQLDGFLPDRRSFDGNELILNQGFLYQSLIQPYALAAANLATLDLATARTLADRLPMPEVRLMTEMFVARGVLEKDRKNDNANADRQAWNSQSVVFRDVRF